MKIATKALLAASTFMAGYGTAQAITVPSVQVTNAVTFPVGGGNNGCLIDYTATILYSTPDTFFGPNGADRFSIDVVDSSGNSIGDVGFASFQIRHGLSRIQNVSGTGPQSTFMTIFNAPGAPFTGPLFLAFREETYATPPATNTVSTNPIVAQAQIPNSMLAAGGAECSALVQTNTAPVADAGADQGNITPGSTVTLDASASTDADNDALTYSWTQVSGPAVTLNNPNSANPTFVAPGGTNNTPIVFQLTVNDGTVSSVTDTVTVGVQDNVAVTTKAIGDFLARRNSLILSHQPDAQRRIDRLQGRNAPGGTSVNGAFLPGSDKLPVRATFNDGTVVARASLSAAQESSYGNAKSSSIDIWAEAQLSDFRYLSVDGDFRVFYAGADITVHEDLLIGVMGQYDITKLDGTNITGVREGEGWMVGPYVTARLSDNLFVDARAAWGRSTNDISPFGTYVDEFKSSRILLSAALTGEFKLGKKFTLRPEAAIHYIDEKQHAYVDSLSSTIPSQSVDQGQVSIAPRLHYDGDLGGGWKLRPYVEARGIYTFGDNMTAVSAKSTRLRMEGGFDLLSESGFRANASYFHDGIGDSGLKSNGFKVTLGLTF